LSFTCCKVKKGFIITFNDDAIKASVEEVTRAIGVNFQANAQDVTLSLVSYNGDPSWLIDKSAHFSNNVISWTLGIVPLSTGIDSVLGTLTASPIG
jgi:hypothetical protein